MTTSKDPPPNSTTASESELRRGIGGSNLRTNWSRTLLGRLRLKLLDQLDPDDQFGTASRVRLYLARRYREAPAVADLERHILHLRHYSALNFGSLVDAADWKRILNALEDEPLPTTFVEMSHCRSPWPQILGVLIECEELNPWGFVYTLTALGEAEFPEACLGRMELRTSRKATVPEVSWQEGGTWKRSRLKDLDSHGSARFLVRVLASIVGQREARRKELGTLPIPAHPFAPDPPRDAELQRRLASLLKGLSRCSQGRVRLADVRPFDIDFCLGHPLDLVERRTNDLRVDPARGGALLVYWDGECFVMSDDYIEYLSYRTLGVESVPVVALGFFPAEHLQELRRGGRELLPPIGLAPSEIETDDPMGKDLALDSRLRRHIDTPSDALATLYAIHILLSKLIHSPRTAEKDLQRLLAAYPVVLDPHGVRLFSEVRLGKQYRIDLVIQSDLAIKRLQFIELEASNKAIFTKSGRPRAEVTHALQQVEDWLRWWREHPTSVPPGLDATIDPDGLVVMGRDIGMTADDRRRLASLNAGRSVQLVTYDDLLRQMESLMEHLERVAPVRV